jgi:hypothetical protein
MRTYSAVAGISAHDDVPAFPPIRLDSIRVHNIGVGLGIACPFEEYPQLFTTALALSAAV